MWSESAGVRLAVPTFACGLKVDVNRKMGCQVQVSPVPENVDEIQGFMEDLLAKRGLIASTEIKDDRLVLDIDFPSDQAGPTLARVQPAVFKAFESQITVMSNRRSARPGMPRIIEGGGSDSGGAFLPGSTGYSGGSRSSGGCRTRRG